MTNHEVKFPLDVIKKQHLMGIEEVEDYMKKEMLEIFIYTLQSPGFR